MGRTFDGSTSLYRTDSPPVTAPPFTVSGWFKVATSQGGSIFSLSDANGDNRFRLNAFGNFAIEVSTDIGSSGQFATSSLIAPANVWAHACGVWTSAASRAAFLNGGNKGTDTVSATPTGIIQVAVGTSFFESSTNGMFVGDLAEVAVWNAVLTDAEVLLLSRGISPLRMRPGNLVAYYPLLRDPGVSAEVLENNYARNATDRSLNNKGIAFANPTTADSHPPVQPMLVGLRQGRSYAGIPGVSLTAASYTDAGPSFGAATVGQKHALVGGDFVDTPWRAIQAIPELLQTHLFIAGGITVAPVIPVAPFGLRYTLPNANAVTAGHPSFTTSPVGQSHVALATVLVKTVPTVFGAGTLAQKHIFVPSNLTVANPVFSAANFYQAGTFSGGMFTVAPPTIPAGVLTQKHGLVAVALAASSPALSVSTSSNALIALALGVAPPSISASVAGFAHILHAANLIDGSPFIGVALVPELIAPPEVWLRHRLKRWSNDRFAEYYDEDGTEDEGPVQQAIFSNLNDEIELTINSRTLVGRTSPGRGPAETIQVASPLHLEDHLTLRIDIHQLADDLAGIEAFTTLPLLDGVSADLNTLNDKILALDARLVTLETRSYVDRGGVALITPENDFVHQVADDGGVVILNPSGNLARGTFKLPRFPAGRQKIDFIAVKSVNNLTFLTDNVAHTLANPPSGVTSGKCITAVFGPTLQTWLFFA